MATPKKGDKGPAKPKPEASKKGKGKANESQQKPKPSEEDKTMSDKNENATVTEAPKKIKKSPAIMAGTMTCRAAAEQFGVPEGELKAAIKAGKLTYVQNGLSEKLRPSLYPEDVKEYIATKRRLSTKAQEAANAAASAPGLTGSMPS